ncbi:MAG: T9SS type A sorting domain-containing protein [Ignavibacteria bacterium]|jgi:hypothetical protein
MKNKLLYSLIIVLLSIFLYSANSYSQAPLKVLFENWTSSTCGPCANNNPLLRAWIADNWANIVCVAYHVGWPSPGNDPMYLYNPTQSYDRRYYYGVNAVPEGIMQGSVVYLGYPFNWSDMTLHVHTYASSTVPSGLSVVDTRIPPDSNKANITVVNYTALPSGSYYLRVMVVEHWIIYSSPPGSNGETIFENVFRKSLPTSQGTSIPTAAGTYNYEFRYQIDPVWRDTSINTIAFIQNDNDHSIGNTSRNGMITGINQNINEIPRDISLSQNYPNPFNPSTNIKFSIPKDDYVTLKVYDMLGNEVQTLVEGNHKAGSYTLYFDGSNLSSGVYFYKLTAGSFIETKKMMLIK